VTVNFKDVRKQVTELGENAPQREKELVSRREMALATLRSYENEADAMQQKVQEALQFDKTLRCAIPNEVPLTMSRAAPGLQQPVTVIAADGSQINYDRHAEVEYALINFGAIIARSDSGEAPKMVSESEMFYGDRLFTPHGIINETDLASERDLGERRFIARLVENITPPIISLTDGPLELWGAKNSDEDQTTEFKDKLSQYKDILLDLESLGVTPAGYVDKPGADLVVRLLELAITAKPDLPNIKKLHPFRGVRDSHLFKTFLQPGERSAIFRIEFFYINVGLPGKPSLARMEIPAWVAQDSLALDNLHATLIDQSRILGNRPFPYFLHRAHEIAVVSMQEKEQVDQMVARELMKRGILLDGSSNKQYYKNTSGRARYKR
jgi:hypothetical protein